MSTLNEQSLKQIERLAAALKGARSVVALTGAGISVPSGIPDFRSAEGLYSTKFGDLDPETILSRRFFTSDPQDFFRFYKEKMVYESAKPNPAHILLAELEKAGVLGAVVTQNIDGLHQAAGSKRVLELHGSVHRNTCMRCGKKYGLDSVMKADGVPKCDCGGTIKPDVVLYGEWLDPDVMDAATAAVRRADMLLVIGTSLAVSTASFVLEEFEKGTLAFVNKGQTIYDGVADILIRDDCATVAEELLKML